MDAPEVEQDVQLERSAPNLLANLAQSLEPFLLTSGQIRRNVRTSDTDRLVNLLEPFQELPQLLDPHLKTYVPLLAETFIKYLRAPPSKPPTTHLLIPLSKAICKLLYTFCKIRGEKVIVQFLSTETRHLELLLSALEKGNQDVEQRSGQAITPWGWEERYITLLWLSQLLLAPFDLASISSQGSEAIVELNISGFVCPPDVPAVTLRVISLAVRYLSSSGKERDASKILLVRVAMRPDMQQVGVLQALVKWALSCLDPSASLQSSPYYYIGVLSFIAGMLVSSAGTSDMVEYLPGIFNVTRDQDDKPTTILDSIKKSAVSRKIIIKIFRAIASLELSNPNLTDLDRVQTLIGDLLDSLEDSATPVRLAASKALSIITMKLDPDMASQVIDVVLDTFHSTYRMVERTRSGKKTPDLSNVKPFQWHGLVLTFSHLLYRRSIPPASLPAVLTALRLALAFEKRSATSATSTGTNVRDAANFGIWALARRYTTGELQAINLKPDVSLSMPALQTLATDLVISGSLDPAGNIRRGSSAALQELIGRNPDTIHEGIRVVQVVDYHAIALRSRAVQEVAIEAAALSDEYFHGLLHALLAWRGVKDTDATARRFAASAIGKLVWEKRVRSSIPWEEYRRTLSLIADRLNVLGLRDGDERHGLILCLASIIGPFTKECQTISSLDGESVLQVLSITHEILTHVNHSWPTLRNPALIAEGTCRLLLATNGLLKINRVNTTLCTQIISGQLAVMENFMTIEEQSITVISEAAAELMTLVKKEDADELIASYIEKSKTFSSGRHASKTGAYLSTLFQCPVEVGHRHEIINTVLEVWKQDSHIDTRVLILRCLGTSLLLQTDLDKIFNLVEEGLDDFTTNAQGDVGSKVRIEAAKVVGALWRASKDSARKAHIRERLCERVMRTASEKLDKVRREGQQCLPLDNEQLATLSQLDLSSELYFRYLLDVQFLPWWVASPHKQAWSATFLEGYVTSADTGAEKLVQASRSALLSFCEANLTNTNLICITLFTLIKRTTASSTDRILIAALEVTKFLFDMQVMQSSSLNWKDFLFHIKTAHYQTANIRKIDVCVKIYGALMLMDGNEVGARAEEKLVSMLLHRYPSVRNVAADELWARRGWAGLKGVDWTRAKKGDLERVKGTLGKVGS